MGAKTSSGMPSSGAGKLTTHVLDTASGRPAAGVRIELFRLTGAGRDKLADVATNPDGRCAAPLLAGEAMQPGTYELIFHVATYFRDADVTLTKPPFLDQVPIRFGIAEAGAHTHVPLLISPYGYSTYRGS
jgi:5-hydroxyisourate hydrolase